MCKSLDRRGFCRKAALAAGAVSAWSASRAYGANERIRLGFIGVGNRGGQLLDAFCEPKYSDMEVVALCDVYQPYLHRAAKRFDGRAETYEDFRKLIQRRDVDAVVIATPDHWHAIGSIDACNAKKDVYVEKPLSITIREGRRMVEAARRNHRIVQVGTQRRSSKLYAKVAALVAENKIGKVTVSRAYRLSNMAPSGIGRLTPSKPPADLNWDLWLGPRPERPYQANIAPYKFRWWDLYSSQVANWGIHYIDAIRWLTGELAPASVCALGGRFAVDDDRTIPDTMEAVYEFASGRLAIFGQYEASSNPAMPRGELELRGTLGTACIDGSTCDVVPETGGQFQDAKPRMKPMRIVVDERDPTIANARNFLDCIKSRKRPNADVEEGHRSTTCSLLANIALATKSRIEWDAQKEACIGNPAANELLHYEYRKPWKLG
jgi:predicted dehydrogenase